MLSEQPLRGDSLWIEHVHEWDRIFAQTGGENDDFVVFAHFDDKFAAFGPNLDVDVARAPLNIDWKNNVCLVSRRES